MGSRDIDNLLERSFSGDPPTAAFRDQVLRDSTAALLHARRSHARWRLAALSAAAVFLAVASFSLGRRSVLPGTTPLVTQPVAVGAPGSVTVPSEMVTWLEAARFFQQLGMEDRMARAIERAGELRSYQSTLADHAAERMIAATGDRAIEEKRNPVGLAVLPRLYEPTRSIDGIMASSLGGYNYASEND